ncbi:hypothetical protein Dimus_028748 [Dionaea muscipula]
MVEVEQGELLGSPGSGNLPRLDMEVPLSEVRMGGRVKEIQDVDFGDDPAMKALVDSVLHEEDSRPPPRRPWNELFTNNRRPCADHKLSKIEFEIPRMPNGSLDLSKGFEMGLFDEITLPGGKTHIQYVEYQHVPSLCGHCLMLGHNDRNCKKSCSLGGPAPLQTGKQNSFDLLDGLGDANGNRMDNGLDVSGRGVGLAVGSGGQEGGLGDRGSPVVSGKEKKGISVVKPDRGMDGGNSSFPQMVSYAGSKLGDSVKGKHLVVKTIASKPLVQRAGFNEGRRRGRGGGHLSFS